MDPDIRREQLLTTALRVVSRRGSCRIVDITSAARVAKGTFYLYFASLEDLLLALRQRIMSDYARDVRNKFSGADASRWRARSEEECVRLVEFIIELGGLHEALFHGPIADRPIEDEQSAAQLMASILRQGAELGALKPLDIDPVARLLFSLVHATADAISRGGDRKRFVDSMLQLVREWLFSAENRDVPA